jgi:hypothetical protein
MDQNLPALDRDKFVLDLSRAAVAFSEEIDRIKKIHAVRISLIDHDIWCQANPTDRIEALTDAEQIRANELISAFQVFSRSLAGTQ